MDPPETSGGVQGSNVGESSVKTSRLKDQIMTTKNRLVETLDQLSPEDFRYFKLFIPAEPSFLPISWSELKAANTEDLVELMMKYGTQSVEETKKILLEMGRLDLVERLALVRENPSLMQKVEEIESDLEPLLKTLFALSDDSLSQFWERYLDRERHFSPAGFTDLKRETFPLSAVKIKPEILAVSLLQREGKQAVDVTKRILTDIKEIHLVQRLLDHRSRNKKKPDDHLAALLHKAAMMAAMKGLLLETLTKLNPADFEKFKIFLDFTSFQKKLPQILRSDLQTVGFESTVNLMLATYGQRCLEVTSQVLTDMNRTDLLENLPEKPDGDEEKLSMKELWPGLINKVEAMESVLELLLEALSALNEGEQELFINWVSKKTFYVEDQYQLPFKERLSDLQAAVLEMVQLTGLKSVETTKDFLMEIKRPDLLQRIETSSKRQEKKLSVDERRSAVMHKVALMAAFKQLLTDVLSDLKKWEFEDFKKFLNSILSSDYNPYRSALSLEPVPLTVDKMVETFGLRSLDVSMEILRDINRSDLIQKLLENSSGLKGKSSVDEYLRADVLNRVPANVALRDTLLKMMKDLDPWDVRTFKWLLQFTCFQKGLPDIPDIPDIRLWSMSWIGRSLMDLTEEGLDLLDLVYWMVQRLGQESVDVAREVLTDMKRTDDVQKLTGSSLGSKEELQSLLLQKEASLTAVMEKLLETIEDLDEAEFQHFWRVLQKRLSMKPRRRTLTYFVGTKWKVAELMLEEFHEQTLDEAIQILKQINWFDLVQKISVKDSTGPVKRLDAKESKGVMADSSCWTELVPEENRTDSGEAPTYSFQCEAGHFECSVSGLRWVCSEKVIFKYRFCSWDGHMERIESRGYMPAGPMMDITLITGKMMEVFLPHWICTDDIPKPLDWFAVLHMDDCGDAVEKVSEVSSAHVKLSEPIFSPRAVLMKAGFPVKFSCNVLIYQTNNAFLTLHVYLIPRDPGLEKKMDQEKTATGYKVIRKADPEKSLKMNDYFILTSDLDAAEVSPKERKLRYQKGEPSFFEVYIADAKGNFRLMLRPDGEERPVWDCAVREGDYQRRGQAQELHFVDRHREELIQRVTNIGPILDGLLKKKVIQQEAYDKILPLRPTQKQMREIFSCLRAGVECRDIFFVILQQKEPILIRGLI